MKQYLSLLEKILTEGVAREDRTGTGTLSVFAHQIRFNLEHGFPLLTTKKIHFASIVHELLWFLSGDTNIAYLQQNGVSIWNEWADKDGNLGPVYGRQWRSWLTPKGEKIDQIATIIKQLKETPNSRRIVVSAWNVADLADESLNPQENVKKGKMALSPCHVFFQFYVANKKLSCQLYQRSCDTFLGLPFNLASYALLTHLVSQQCELEVGDFIWTGGDIHLYRNHLDQARQQLTREPMPLPSLIIKRKATSITGYHFEDFAIDNYQSHPPIKAPISV